MIVDDSTADQFIAKHVIKTFDPEIEILQAYDGREALDMLNTLKEGAPDVIFLDINMPRMNGHEFLEEYNKTDNMNAVIVMLTSSNQVTDKERACKFDCVKNYIEKPLEEHHFEQLLK